MGLVFFGMLLRSVNNKLFVCVSGTDEICVIQASFHIDHPVPSQVTGYMD